MDSTNAHTVLLAEPPGPRVVTKFEHAIVYVLMALLVVVIAVATAELVWLLVRDLRSTDVLLLDAGEMFELFGFFLLVLIAMELLATLTAYVHHRVIRMEVVLEVALIAIAQKLIVLDFSRTDGPKLLGLAGLLLALAVARWAARGMRRAETAPA